MHHKTTHSLSKTLLHQAALAAVAASSNVLATSSGRSKGALVEKPAASCGMLAPAMAKKDGTDKSAASNGNKLVAGVKKERIDGKATVKKAPASDRAAASAGRDYVKDTHSAVNTLKVSAAAVKTFKRLSSHRIQ